MKEKIICSWAESHPLMKKYHDKEWGDPVHNDRKLFEMLTLEGAQAGLSWLTVLKKRENYRKAFSNFNPIKVSKYNDKDFKRLINDKEIIRNKLKIQSAIKNAKFFLQIQKEYGSFNKYIWSFVKNKPIINKFKELSEIPAKTDVSDAMSKDLMKKGFKFVGSTICYAFMQAIGMVNDHYVNCFRYKIIRR